MEDHGRPQTDYTGTYFSPCQMPRGRPGGRQMPDPRAVIKFQMPHPRDHLESNTAQDFKNKS